jgi:two-component system, NarL family, invasion response regulator UvrY
MINIILCDDHTLVRKAMKQLLETQSDMKVDTEFGSGEEMLHNIDSIRADVLLIDVSLPGISGIEVLTKIIESSRKLPVIMLSMYPEDQFAVQALRIGAKAYIQKDSDPAILVSAIRKIANGEEYISEGVTKLLLDELRFIKGKKSHFDLSEREYKVMLLIGQGKRLTEIALELNLSIKTVSTYRRRLMEKLGLTKNSQIVQYLLENDLLTKSN